jgi:hypothetical protein
MNNNIILRFIFQYTDLKTIINFTNCNRFLKNSRYYNYNFILKQLKQSDSKYQHNINLKLIRDISNNTDIDIIKYDIFWGADNIQEAFLEACSQGNINIVNYFLNQENIDIHYQRDNAFIVSCYYGQINIVKILMDKGAKVSTRNNKALIYTCNFGYHEILKLIIKKVNINCQNGKY